MTVSCSSSFQIAQADPLDAKQRMVILVGPPEAQFKVIYFLFVTVFPLRSAVTK